MKKYKILSTEVCCFIFKSLKISKIHWKHREISLARFYKNQPNRAKSLSNTTSGNFHIYQCYNRVLYKPIRLHLADRGHHVRSGGEFCTIMYSVVQNHWNCQVLARVWRVYPSIVSSKYTNEYRRRDPQRNVTKTRSFHIGTYAYQIFLFEWKLWKNFLKVRWNE